MAGDGKQTTRVMKYGSVHGATLPNHPIRFKRSLFRGLARRLLRSSGESLPRLQRVAGETPEMGANPLLGFGRVGQLEELTRSSAADSSW